MRHPKVTVVEHRENDHRCYTYLQLNSTHLFISDLDSDMQEVDQEVRDQYLSTLTSLRLLAKFLGFVAFLPYHGAESLPKVLRESQLEVRNKVRKPGSA